MGVLALPRGNESTWLGLFGENWFRMICTAAGCPTSRAEPDTVGSDFIVHDHGHELIRAQVKTTEHAKATGGGYSQDLDVATYDRLRQGTTRGYLILVVVHSRHPRWTRHYRRGGLVASSVHWLDLSGRPATSNSTSVTLSLPFANMLTPELLLGLFPRADDE